MLKSLKSKINKQNSPSITQKISNFDQDFCETILASNLLGEGTYSLEVVSNSESNDRYLTTPSFFRESIGEECHVDFSYLRNSAEDLNCYSIYTSNPSFLPIYTKNVTSLFQNLSLLQSGNDEIFIQLLFTQLNNQWKHNFINQYAEYLSGNDFPSSRRVGRSIQRSFLKVADKLSGINAKRKEIREISEKILDEGYRFELRLIALTKNTETFENELSEILNEYDFFNEMSFVKAKNKKYFIEAYLNKMFTDLSKNQIISEKELIALVTDEQIVNVESKPNSIIEVQDTIIKEISQVSSTNFNLLPIGVKKERSVDEELVSELPMALKKARAIKDSKIEILDVELGATVQRITFKIPKNHVYSDIKSKYEDINSTLGAEINIVKGKDPNTITFLIPCKQREVIYLKELLEDEKFNTFASENPLPFICGVDMYNEPVYKCLTKAPHLLVAGATNSGKSVFINALLITLILLKSPNELRIFLIDPKKVEFSQYDGFAHVEEVITDMDEAVETLDKLIVEMESRYDKFSKIGVRKIDAYNKKSKQQMPYIIFAIDEYNDLKMTHGEVEERIERLGQKARASGIHLIIATQRPDKDVMSGVIKTNIPSRISFKLDNSNEYKTVFGTGIPYRNLLGFGDGVIKFVGQVEEFIRFQAPVITLDEDEEEKTFEKIKKIYKGETIDSIKLETIKKENDLDKLKRIIANTNETRFSKLREHLGKGSNTVKKLMDELVEEGWIKEPESKAQGYQLIICDEELSKWRDDNDEFNN